MSSSSKETPRTVAFFPPRLVSGGTQRHLLEVLKFLDRRRFRPIVISAKRGGELRRAIEASGVELVRLDLGERVVSADMIRCVRQTAALFRTRNVEVVQCFQWRPALIGIAAARLARRGRVVAGRRSAPVERGVRALLEDLVVRLADRVVVNAETLRPRGAAAARTEVIPSGVDTELFRPHPEIRAEARARLGLSAADRVVGTVGRLETRKGTAVLLEAAARLLKKGLPDLQVLVVGDGPLRDELPALAARLGIIDHVTMLGDRSDVPQVLAALDVFVLPSRTEGMSNALLEAMATALPVVATAVGGNPEVVSAEMTGVLVPPDDVMAMADAVMRLATSPILAAQLGAAARRTVEERYGARAMVRRLEAVYAAVADAAPLAVGCAAAAADGRV
ncbi:MAG: glycosyltransferase [Deltaproteobacteria bacterium]|nr:glycosyltransferase [Deltaproteobacteria bacterium]